MDNWVGDMLYYNEANIQRVLLRRYHFAPTFSFQNRTFQGPQNSVERFFKW